jgi:ABC-type polysaccharide/polyol phosphate transport system ATPase subunit
MERIVFRDVSKTFILGAGRQLLRGHMGDWFHPARRPKFTALRDINLTMREGESLAVVGANGAGKSTLLNLATRLCYPDKGVVEVNGRLAAVLELGHGFHGDLTGAENLRLCAALSGLSRQRASEVFGSMVEFSGVGEFINQPLRTYSAGMVMRLAFSVAIHVDPDILVVDEMLAVGDQAFQSKCFERMLDFRRQGKTILCVSHAPETLRQMCDRAILLDHGRVAASGSLDEVMTAYSGRIANPSEDAPSATTDNRRDKKWPAS